MSTNSLDDDRFLASFSYVCIIKLYCCNWLLSNIEHCSRRNAVIEVAKQEKAEVDDLQAKGQLSLTVKAED